MFGVAGYYPEKIPPAVHPQSSRSGIAELHSATAPADRG